jgi:hypothetical protein
MDPHGDVVFVCAHIGSARKPIFGFCPCPRHFLIENFENRFLYK